MANIDMRTREGRAMKAAAEAARMAASAGQVLNVQAPEPERDHRVEPAHEPQEPIKTRNEPRERAMAEIEAREARERGEPIAAAPEEPVEVPSDSTPPGSPDPEAAAPKTPEPAKTVKVKVDGVEFDAPADEVEEVGGVRAYQLMKANENRLAKTNEALAQTRQLQAQLAEMAKAQAPKPVTTTDAEFIQERIETIRFGTPEESAAALTEVMGRGRQTIDQNQLVNQAIAAMQQQAAESQFVQEFSDIVHNPLLLKLIIQEKNDRLAKLKETPDWSNFYRSIGNEVRGAIGRSSQPAQQPQNAPAGNPSQPDKEARKASIVNLPTAAARAALPEAAKPETRDDILNEMRKKRGIPTG